MSVIAGLGFYTAQGAVGSINIIPGEGPVATVSEESIVIRVASTEVVATAAGSTITVEVSQ